MDYGVYCIIEVSKKEIKKIIGIFKRRIENA